MSEFALFFGGAEEPGWRRLLVESGVGHITLSYRHLHRRLPKTKPWLLEEKVPAGVEVFLDSAAFNAHKDDREHALDLMGAYTDFVEANIDRITFFSEYDALPNDRAWIEDQREHHWSLDIYGDKFMPVWHVEHGLSALRDLAGQYERVGIPKGSITPQVLAAVRSLHGETSFHAIGEADPDVLKHGFNSASTHSWLSATKYGETIVWQNNRLKRYPAKMKDQARRKHRTLFEKAGFDPGAIAIDNNDEVARFTIWSFLRLEEHLGRRALARPGPVTEPTDEVTPTNAEIEVSPVHGLPVPVRKERLALPVFVKDAEGVPVLAGVPVRRCNSCHVAGSCPAAQYDAECAFDIPIQVKTKEQLLGLMRGIIEMQAQRVAFTRYTEEIEGGYPDSTVSVEMDRLMRVISQAKDIQDDRDFLQISVQAHAKSGVLSRIFGSQAAAPTRQLERGISAPETDHIIAEVLDAEVVSDNSHNGNGARRGT